MTERFNPSGQTADAPADTPALTAAQALIVWCTVPDDATAASLSDAILHARLAACVSALPAVQSRYWWQGKIDSGTEILLMIKTMPQAYPQLQQLIRAQHPYDVPEIIATPVVAGLPDYLSWLGASLV